MKYEITLEGVTREVDIRRGDGGYTAVVDGRSIALSAQAFGATGWILSHDDTRHTLDLSVDGDDLFVLHKGVALRGSVVDPRTRALDLAAGGDAGAMTTAMPGAVVRVLVGEGDAVTEGQVLVVVEAMKMENEFKAPFDGVVASLAVAAGQAVEAGSTLIVVDKS